MLRKILGKILPRSLKGFIRASFELLGFSGTFLRLRMRGYDAPTAGVYLEPQELERLPPANLARIAGSVVEVAGRRLDWFVDKLEECVRPVARGKRVLVWPFERTGAVGHVCMDPFYVKSVYGDRFDEIIVVTRPKGSALNPETEMFDTAMAGTRLVFTEDPILLALSGRDMGMVERGPFTFFLHAYPHISRAFFRHCMSDGRKAFYHLSDAQEERGRRLMSMIGVPAGAKWVVVHAREPGFHTHTFDNYRCTSIESYFDSIRFLAAQGYIVLRVGDRSMKRLPDFGRQVIDVPFLPNYDSLMDVYAIAHCEFMMSAHSGPCMLARAFDRPCLGINVPITYAHIPGERDMLALRRYHRRDKQGNATGVLSYAELLDAYFDLGFEAPDLNGYKTSEFSSKEVLPFVQEMLKRQNAARPISSPAQERFMAANRAIDARAAASVVLQRKRYDWFGSAKPGTTVPDAYCEINSGFV